MPPLTNCQEMNRVGEVYLFVPKIRTGMHIGANQLIIVAPFISTPAKCIRDLDVAIVKEAR